MSWRTVAVELQHSSQVKMPRPSRQKHGEVVAAGVDIGELVARPRPGLFIEGLTSAVHGQAGRPATCRIFRKPRGEADVALTWRRLRIFRLPAALSSV